ncbi:TRAP transporter small permease [Oceanobacillus jeddahense]|uniref:TRAP transporter small permease n=1 Tax=Oceanobacillus jeddahense TaxID=1462527 RepID=A0ABY5JRE5_9BACI|nr:TRAP transporter small permease [Oceanobacillus jeddahense]UUI02865.1 TRAP transporter small permease [Oceanobacillus jeddahense]
MNLMKKVDKVLGIITMLLFSALLFIVIIQILSRYFPFDFIWTEELSRYLFVYSIVTAAPLALRKQEFIRVDLLIENLSPRVRKIYESVISVMIFLFSVVLFIYGIQLVSLGADFYAPTLGFPMSYTYAAVPLLAILLMVYSVVSIIDQFTGENEKREEEQI